MNQLNIERGILSTYFLSDLDLPKINPDHFTYYYYQEFAKRVRHAQDKGESPRIAFMKLDCFFGENPKHQSAGDFLDVACRVPMAKIEFDFYFAELEARSVKRRLNAILN